MARARLPDERNSIVRRFKIADELELYVIMGFYDDWRPGEIFIHPDHDAPSFVKGILDGLALSISIGLQHGAPVLLFADKFVGQQFEPRGFTKDPKFPQVASVLDMIGRWIRDSMPDNKLRSDLRHLATLMRGETR